MTARNLPTGFTKGKWTTTPPTKPGWYWVRWKPDWCFADEIVRVRHKRGRCRDTGELVVCPTGTDAQYALDIALWWSGPIDEPEEPQP